MAQTVELLENVLRAWEDFCFFNEAAIRLGIWGGNRHREELVGPVRHWRELRNHLLTLKGGDFDTNRFCSKGSNPNTYETVPLQLAAWTLDSRRVFQVSNEIVKKFIAADYSGIKWSDLLWPFDAFVVALEEPLIVDWGPEWAAKLDMMLVTSVINVCPSHRYAAQDSFECRYFFTGDLVGNASASILTDKERETLKKRLEKRQWVKLQPQLVRMAERFQYVLASGDMPPGFQEPSIIRKGTEIENDPLPKILAGLCLYLESLPTGIVEGYQWQRVGPKVQRQARGIITDGELVCKVENFHSISPATIVEFSEAPRKGPAYIVTPHWRRAHYRRRKGEGHNPRAPREVYVKPTLIHKEHLPEGSIPGGAQSQIK